MRAVLMAGGSGTRLRPLTCDLPKPMVPILNRPIAEHIINLLKRHNIYEIIVTLHYLPDVMQDYFGDGEDFGVDLKYAVEDEQPLGTAGSVKNVEDLLDDTFVVISGDSITDFDLQEAIAFHKEKQAKATLILTRVPNPLEFGLVITDENDRIERFLEKPSSSEVFSDTVNTGTYILEPEILQYLAKDKELDFSQDLFPLLLEKNESMYGYVAKGYWCDVGNLESYREAQYDALHGKVNVEYGYDQVSPGLWVGEHTYQDPTAKIDRPVIIGNNCRIGAGVKIEAGTVIGDNVSVGADSHLKQPIIGSGVKIGEEVELSGCVIGRGAHLDRRCQILEGAVVGPLCGVGEEAKISPGVKIWPSKRIEKGATLNINFIWGTTAKRNLFGHRGVSGLANIDITPEFAVKLGAAYGSTLKVGDQVIVSRDQRKVSRMVSRSMIAGLMSVGINIQNMEATAIPITRTMTPKLGVSGGIHVRVHPDKHDHILIEFFDELGINISKAKEKKIEGAYFKEDLRRMGTSEIGDVSYVPTTQILETYSKTFENHTNIKAIRLSSSKIVIDYVYAVSGAVLPHLLGKFGCDVVILNASLRETGISIAEKEKLLVQLGHVVEALQANLGVQVSANGEQLILVDEGGLPIRGEILTSLMVNAVFTAKPRSTVVVPVQVSSAVEQIAHRHEGKVIRTKANPTSLMEASQVNPNVVLGGSAEMGFIFPSVQPGFDAMYCIAKLLEMLTIQERSLAQSRADLPRVAHKSYTMRCPWRTKGALMRHLVEINPRENLDLTDGVKIVDHKSDNWVLILPDAGEPLVHIYANSENRDWVDQSLKYYRGIVQGFIDQSHDTGLDRMIN